MSCAYADHVQAVGDRYADVVTAGTGSAMARLARVPGAAAEEARVADFGGATASVAPGDVLATPDAAIPAGRPGTSGAAPARSALTLPRQLQVTPMSGQAATPPGQARRMSPDRQPAEPAAELAPLAERGQEAGERVPVEAATDGTEQDTGPQPARGVGSSR